MVSFYSANERHGTCYISAIFQDDARRTGIAIEAMVLSLSHLFKTFPYRKVYLESLASNSRNFESGAGRFFDLEGTLKGHEYHDGEYQDVFIFAISRENWKSNLANLEVPTSEAPGQEP